MQLYNVDHEIATRVSSLNYDQKEDLLDYIEGMRARHSKQVYRRRAMKQIREALTSSSIRY